MYLARMEPTLLKEMYKVWDEAQIFVYYEPKFDVQNRPTDFFQVPDCFAYLLSPNHALTTSSCFMNLKEISKLLKNNAMQSKIEERIQSGVDIKPNTEKFVVAQVLFIFIQWPLKIEFFHT